MAKIREVTKAIVAVAGYGTRFLPVTKVQPKQMLPLLDKPIVQCVVEELVASGIKDIIIVTQAGHHVLEDHFDSSVELEEVLEKDGKLEYLKMIRKIPNLANFVYVRQTKDYPYGNGTPLLVTAPLIDPKEAFVYVFGDDVTISKTPVTKQLIEAWKKYHSQAVIAVEKTEEPERYGIIEYRKKGKVPYQIKSIVEKPSRKEAPSDMAQYGRFVLTWPIVEILKKQRLGKGNELWLADALNSLAKKGTVIAPPIEGQWLTTGDPLRWLIANLEFAFERKDISQDLKKFLAKRMSQ